MGIIQGGHLWCGQLLINWHDSLLCMYMGENRKPYTTRNHGNFPQLHIYIEQEL